MKRCPPGDSPGFHVHGLLALGPVTPEGTPGGVMDLGEVLGEASRSLGTLLYCLNFLL